MRRLLIVFAVSGGIYVGLYIANSLSGGYWLMPTRDGRDRYSMGISLPTAIEWQPKWGYESRYSSTFLGIVWYPLIQIDRQLFHPTKYLTEETTQEWLRVVEPSEVHPLFRAEFVRTRNAAGKN